MHQWKEYRFVDFGMTFYSKFLFVGVFVCLFVCFDFLPIKGARQTPKREYKRQADTTANLSKTNIGLKAIGHV